MHTDKQIYLLLGADPEFLCLLTDGLRIDGPYEFEAIDVKAQTRARPSRPATTRRARPPPCANGPFCPVAPASTTARREPRTLPRVAPTTSTPG
jgi:hypothetical protein